MWLEFVNALRRTMLLLCLSMLVVACASTKSKNAESADVHLQLGVRYMDMNKLEVAKENLLLALKKAPDNAEVQNALAFLYERLNDNDQAKNYYEKALKLSPNDWSVQNNAGRFFCDRGEYEAGMGLLTQAATNPLNDRQWIALTNAGRCQVAVRQQQRAKAYFKQALLLNDTYPPALMEMQKLSYQSGEYWPAKAYLQRYLSVANHTPGTLWFGMQTELALGNNGLAKEYQKLLLDKFPLSNEAKQIQPNLP
ncbi:MAG: type IV pilus biogenesis/stability protein PilW [Methylococcales bacterium]|nr:type IV pilus biogenesis/stability protein PilW [Methylococcales bacterium]